MLLLRMDGHVTLNRSGLPRMQWVTYGTTIAAAAVYLVSFPRIIIRELTTAAAALATAEHYTSVATAAIAATATLM